jgi:hypothetical protein
MRLISAYPPGRRGSDVCCDGRALLDRAHGPRRQRAGLWLRGPRALRLVAQRSRVLDRITQGRIREEDGDRTGHPRCGR